MKTFWSFVLKEFRHVFRDKRSLLILLGLPVAMILIFGFALSNEIRESDMAVLDFSKDRVTQHLTNRLHQSHYFNITEQLQRYSEIEELFKNGNVKLVIVFPANFEETLNRQHGVKIQLIADASDPNTANTTSHYAAQIIGSYQQDLMAGQKIPHRITTEIRMLYNPQLESAYIFVPGVMTLILMLLGAMMTSVSIVKEKEMGTMEVLLVSPLKPIWVVISKAMPYLLLCFIDVLIILILSYTLLEMPMRGSLVLLLLECLLFIFTTLSLGLLISTVVQAQEVAMFVSLVGLLMPSLIFSGFMFPIENMPSILQWISYVVPTRWFFNILQSIMIKGLDFSYVIKDTLILGGMTLFFLTVALRKFKIRLE